MTFALARRSSQPRAAVLFIASCQALLLVACGSDDEHPIPEADVSDAGDVLGPDAGALRIRVRNASDDVLYVHDPGFWLTSDSASVGMVDIGGGEQGDVSLYTNQPTCDGIGAGEESCGQHSDRLAGVLVLAAHAEYVESWDGRVWQHSSRSNPDCESCMRSVLAPAATYKVSLRVGTQLDCGSGATCTCEPHDYCTIYDGTLRDYDEVETTVDWPSDTEVVVTLPSMP